MKKKYRKYILFITGLITAIFLAKAGISVNAEKTSITSYGELIFNNGEAAIYYEDIQYIQNELNELFNEITE